MSQLKLPAAPRKAEDVWNPIRSVAKKRVIRTEQPAEDTPRVNYLYSQSDVQSAQIYISQKYLMRMTVKL